MADGGQDFVTPTTRDVLGRFVCNTFEEARATWENGPGFDAIVIGGGTFGATLASSLYFRSEPFMDGDPFAPPDYRVLLLEAGPFLLPEHVQNHPMLMLFGADPTSIRDLQPDPALRKRIAARREVWGLPWHSNQKFPGLAYCVGGRSLYWGGWSPQFLDSEMPIEGSRSPWPSSVVDNLKGRFSTRRTRSWVRSRPPTSSTATSAMRWRTASWRRCREGPSRLRSTWTSCRCRFKERP